MARVIEMTVRFEVEETQNDWNPHLGTAEWLERALREYMTSPDAPLLEDYGPESWGGYDGPYITKAEVIRSEVK